MDDPIVNRVQESGLIQVDLSSLLEPRPVDSIDVAQWLDNGFILREKPFRDAVPNGMLHRSHITSWRWCAPRMPFCTNWAWMLAAKLRSLGSTAIVGSLAEQSACLARGCAQP